jgi:hypothetical protein
MSTPELVPTDPGEPKQVPWSRSMQFGIGLVLVGAIGSLVGWLLWSTPGSVSALFDFNLGNLTSFALNGTLPGSQSGLASSRGAIGVLLAVVVLAVVVATRFTANRRHLLLGCAWGLALASIGLVVNAYTALRNTLDATNALDDAAGRIVAATASLPSVPLLGSVSDAIAGRVHHARQHVIDHSVVPAVVALVAGGIALIGAVLLLIGSLRPKATPTET